MTSRLYTNNKHSDSFIQLPINVAKKFLIYINRYDIDNNPPIIHAWNSTHIAFLSQNVNNLNEFVLLDRDLIKKEWYMHYNNFELDIKYDYVMDDITGSISN